jgi:hypothetical protein
LNFLQRVTIALNHIRFVLHFSLQVKPTGRLNLPDASWGAMMDAVSKGTVDFSLAPVIMLPSTFEKVDFTAPIHSVRFLPPVHNQVILFEKYAM